jgi:DNA-binding CsgD family transcriptional regulator
MTAFDLASGPIPPRPEPPHDQAVDAARELQQLALGQARRIRAERDRLAARINAAAGYARSLAGTNRHGDVGRAVLELLEGPDPARASNRAGAAPALSPPETRVLMLVARGSSNEQIAAGLHLSVHTVQTHLRRLRVKLGARDRAHAVALAYQLGLFGPDNPMITPAPLAATWKKTPDAC